MALLKRVLTRKVALRLVAFLQALALVKIIVGIYILLPVGLALIVAGAVLLVALVLTEVVLSEAEGRGDGSRDTDPTQP